MRRFRRGGGGTSKGSGGIRVRETGSPGWRGCRVSSVLRPIEYGVSWVLLALHALLAPVFGRDSGWAWGLAIVGLVVVTRALLFPLFVKQTREHDRLQRLQPEIKALQERYGDDRERLSAELMRLYRETGTNPLASCLPLLTQALVLLALFRVLYALRGGDPVGLGALESRGDLVRSAQDASLLGLDLSDTLLTSGTVAGKSVAVLLIALMAATAVVSQQLIRKNAPPGSADTFLGRYQRWLALAVPAVFAVMALNFPAGVLLYWSMSNVWTIGQQLYMHNHTPRPQPA